MIKHIELTENHKTKLLEMCYSLLIKEAEHSWHWGDDNVPDGITIEKIPSTNDYMVCFYHDDGTNRIHWFELIERVLEPKIDEKLILIAVQNHWDSYDPQVFAESDHPIDSLYSKFKELK